MSTDKSLRSKSTLERHRNVLNRHERIVHLKENGLWSDEKRPFNLPKVAHRKAAVGKKAKAEKKADAEAAAGETAAPAATKSAAQKPAK